MRAFVLLLLGGGLLWLVLTNFGSTRAADEGSPDEPAQGILLSHPVQSASAAQQVSAVNHPAAVAAPEPSAPIQASPRAPTVEDPDRRAPGIARPIDAEVELASELLHRPQALLHSPLGRASGVAPDRVRLAVVFAELITSSRAKAQADWSEIQASGVGTQAERALLERVLQSGSDQPTLASISHESPLARAATMALLALEGEASLKAGQHRDASRIFSDLLLEEIRAPWAPEQATIRDWTVSLRRAQAAYHWKRDADWPSVQTQVARGDSLITVRKRLLSEHPDLLLCTGLIARANELNQETIHPGQVLRAPSERAAMLVDLTAHWAFFMLGDHVVAAWEVGVGKPGSETPPGQYTVGEKSTEPMWFRPGKQPVPYGDPENPLGTRWIAWLRPDGTDSHLGFHGTKEPDSIGLDLSQGCIRMRNADVEELFEILPKGAAITVEP